MGIQARGCLRSASGNPIVFLYCQPTAHRFAFSDSAWLRVGQTRADSASLRLVPVMKSSHRGAPASPLTPSGVESSVSHGRRPLRESLDIRALPPSRRPRPSRERQTGVTGRFPVRRAEPTFLADEMSAPADFQVNDAVSEERTSGRSNADCRFALYTRPASTRTRCAPVGQTCDPRPTSAQRRLQSQTPAKSHVPGGRAESSHCWESPRAFSVKSKYNLALSIHPGARIASAGILAIQIKCCDLDCRIDIH